VVNLSPAVAEEVGVDPFGQKGVMVLKTGPGAARQVGLRPGDIIRQVNGRKISTTGDLAGAVAVPARVWQVVVERGGQQIAVTLEA